MLCERILVLNRSKPVGYWAAAALMERLRELSSVTRIDCLPPGGTLPAGAPAPDLVVSFTASVERDSWMPVFRRLVALGSAEAFSAPRESDESSYVHTLRWLPRRQLHWGGKVLQKSRVLGWSTPNARHAVTGEHLGKTIGEAIVAHTQDGIGKAPLRIDRERLTGKYRTVETIPFLARAGQPIFSGPAPLRHNVSLWIFEDSRPPKSLVPAVEAELTEAGWKRIPWSVTTPGGSNDLYFGKDDKRISLHSRDRFARCFPGESVDPQMKPQHSPRWEYLVQYQEIFSREEAARVVMD